VSIARVRQSAANAAHCIPHRGGTAQLGSTGYAIRLGRLFNSKTGRSFITALDHGVTIGVPAGAEDVSATLETVIAGGPDAVLIGPGTIEKAGCHFARRGAPAPIVRCDWIINDPYINDLGEGYRVLISPAEALALGADAAVMFLMIGAGEGTLFADNVRAVAQAAQEAHRAGLPLIVEVVLWGTRVEDKKDADRLAWGSRMAVELGADAIKTEYTGDPASMRKIIDTCGAPVLLLGGSKSNDPEALWQGTRAAIEAGAKGVIYGRNVWQHDDPVAVSARLREIIHG
jgi:DhnA family fructose-bisphosphate aldolase class Ia